MTVTFGIDVSHHQGGSLNFVRLRQSGAEFCYIKATESSGFKDPQFHNNLARARSAGMLVAAYHYVRSGATATSQVKNVTEWVPKDVPVIPDVEAGSGDISLVRDFVAKLQAAGYHVPLLYLPRWYWQQIGSPPLGGLPSLWSSRYPDNVSDTLLREFSDVPPHYWVGYGGLGVTVLQFTSSAFIAGVTLDANAYIGTREQLAAVINGTPLPLPDPQKEEDEHVKNLILAHKADSDEIWVGDGMHRRHISDMDELTSLQYWIGQKGGDATIVENWHDLRVLGVDVTETAKPVEEKTG